MLSPDDFFAGPIHDAPVGSLVVPIDGDGAYMLIGEAAGPEDGDPTPRIAFLLSVHRFQSFRAEGNRSWRGLIIPNIRLKVDVTSARLGGIFTQHLGAIEQNAEGLYLIGAENQRPARVLMGFGRGHADIAVAFSRWSVMLGDGPAMQTLATIDLDHEDVVMFG